MFLFLNIGALAGKLSFLFAVPFGFLNMCISCLLILGRLSIGGGLTSGVYMTFDSGGKYGTTLRSSMSGLFKVLL